MPFFVKRLINLSLPLLFLPLLAGCGDNSPSRPSDSYGPPTATYSISGSITPAAGSAVDSDTNDPLSSNVENNSSLLAQNLPNPVVLGGYIVRVATGNTGDQFEAVPDDQDWYQLTLAAGQTVTLTISDHDGDPANAANPDFDMFLYPPGNVSVGGEILSAETFNRQESFTLPAAASGDYFLQVIAPAYTAPLDPAGNTAGSNYVLSVGAAPQAVQPATLNPVDEFIPGEVVVRFRQPEPPAGSVSPLAITAQGAVPGLVAKAGQPDRPMLFQMERTVAPTPQAVSSLAAERRSKGFSGSARDARRDTVLQVEALRQRADVISADLNYIRRPLLVPDDSLFPSQWNSSQINLPQAWDLTTGDAGFVVAVLDTGVLMNHPDLAGRLCTATENCRGYDFVANPVSGADGDGIDADPSDPGDQSLPDGSSSYHGTLVAGLVGAIGNNALGVAGADWKTRIMPVRVLGVGTSTSYDVIQGVSYAAGLNNDSGTVPQQIANVINLSLGGGGFSQTEQDLFNQLHANGIFVVAAAGNQASSLFGYPASYDGVVSVSAVDIDKNLAPYSNTGARIDVAAPGGNLATDRNGDGIADGVLSTGGDDSGTLIYNYLPVMGTSMASPQVAGVAALMLAVDPLLTPADFDTLLAAGSLTEDLAGDGAAVRNDSFGYGLIDAQKAVLEALNLAGGGTLPASLAISPSYLQFGTTATSLPLTLSNAGGGSLNITSISFTASWITAVTLGNETPPASGLGDYSVSIDRTGLTEGVYAATITFNTDIPGTSSLTVLMQVGASGAADVGLQTVYLLDTSGNRLQSLNATVDPLSGTYSYNFTGLLPGSYLVEAGTDADHDGQICDPGEACGGYPLLTDPAVIEIISSDRTGVDFSSSFDGNR